jgi:hypothetical protein
MKTSAKQKIYETRWSYSEQEKSVQRRLNKYYIDVNKARNAKEKIMVTVTDTEWTLQDLNKLKSNKDRPMGELIPILKNKFNEDQIREMKAKIISELTKEGAPKDKRSLLCKFSDEQFKVLYEHCETTRKDFLAKYPEFRKIAAESTIGWYLNAIRAEIKGTQTHLSQHFYDLVRLWYNNTHAVPMPKRGSTSVRSLVLGRKNKKEVIEEKKGNTDSSSKVEIIEQLPDKPVSVPEVDPSSLGFTKAAQVKFGLVVDGVVRVIGDTKEHIEGAEMVYRQIGLTSNIQRVKLLVETL